MKTKLLIAVLTTLFSVGNIKVLKEARPRPGKGALTTFRKDLKLHQYFEMDSNAQAYIDLIKCMGLMDKDGKSELVKSTDRFFIATNDSGYFPCVFRDDTLLKRHLVYLKPREEYLDSDPEQLVEQVNQGSRIVTKEDAIFEQVYPLKNFPKTLRIGAGKGEFAKDAYYVKTLQDALTDQGYQVPADGVFDREIENAVKHFQKKRGLKYHDGIVGEETMKALNIGKFREKSWYNNDLFDPIRDVIDAFYAEN